VPVSEVRSDAEHVEEQAAVYPTVPESHKREQTISPGRSLHPVPLGLISKEVATVYGFIYYDGPDECIIDTRGADVRYIILPILSHARLPDSPYGTLTTARGRDWN
jgi:hypothetical protein